MSLSERLRGLAARAEAAARRLQELGAHEMPVAAEPAAPPWAGLRAQVEAAADLAERYLEVATALEREHPALSRALTRLRSSCLADRETLVWLLAGWDPAVLDRLAASGGAQPSASMNPAIASTRSPVTAISGT
jgi:hypothetical protein